MVGCVEAGYVSCLMRVKLRKVAAASSCETYRTLTMFRGCLQLDLIKNVVERLERA
jgi:hypothetical protein